ncbi:flagellar export protein FliJ [Candidatus Kryptonium thompsonii]|jgi:flagellar export protein FliJ|uniref:Flagellar FliJ protein n=1 Tax=Candidatus Kryptonium thompsonii TaxID=1633631 RepID=A0A0P1ME90_9BACT|nr:flagellar FliJ family protein [Candidatus Kryptonium thompsoni]CUS76818.1 flagellar export protein FliJ [Candidatus Kryptonium thompsoni]CUS77184.1 flagellar export protein FliJ [Candidatus Kryptonium thompsoni]CUS79148.1 flagellar export protein FliJ [Candidatus Kryptonium thompsoni]CUS82529.1 flagellar export protein FliJ [Candidatus Kryptonium thompsoni]CUS92869.1 flagellar export protein FliJ [Candidatus Kryptonium thompsoni]
MARFKLDPVLKVRQVQEKKYKRDLSEIKVIREKAEKLLEDLEAEKMQQMENIEAEEKVKVIDLQIQYAYLNAVAEQVEKQKNALERVLKEEEKRRDILIKTNQNKRMIEKLKQKFNEQILKDFQKKEQTLLDSIAYRTISNR